MPRPFLFHFRKPMALGLSFCLLQATSWAQNTVSIEPVRPVGPMYKRPYLAVSVPDVRLGNSSRLGALIKGGNLYLTAADAISLALENNIDLEISRYNPVLLAWRLERSQAGGALPGVQSGSSQASLQCAHWCGWKASRRQESGPQELDSCGRGAHLSHTPGS